MPTTFLEVNDAGGSGRKNADTTGTFLILRDRPRSFCGQQVTLVSNPPLHLPGWSLVGYSPWGRKRVGHDLATKQQRKLAIDGKFDICRHRACGGGPYRRQGSGRKAGSVALRKSGR